MYFTALKLLFPALKQNKKLTALVFSGVLIMIGLSTCFLKWREFFYNAIQKYDAPSIYLGLAIFTGLALVYVFIYGLTSFYTRYLEFSVRQFLFNKYILKARDKHNNGVAVVEQKTQDDPLRFAKTSIALVKAILDSSVRLPVFLCILAAVAKWWMLVAVLVYAVVGTLLSKKVSNKLVAVEYVQESLEAELRRDIIFYNNNPQRLELPSLRSIVANWQELALRQKYLSWYTSFYGQVSVIFPYCMLVPSFLSHTILLGTLFSTSSAIEQVLSSLSVFVESREIVVDLSMTSKRLMEMEV